MARFLVALPVVVVELVYLASTNADSDNGCLARTREELQRYLVYSLISIVFVIQATLWSSARRSLKPVLGIHRKN